MTCPCSRYDFNQVGYRNAPAHSFKKGTILETTVEVTEGRAMIGKPF